MEIVVAKENLYIRKSILDHRISFSEIYMLSENEKNLIRYKTK